MIYLSSLIIDGGVPLCGVVHVQGAKNSALPILAASLLADGECIIENCPDISDTHTAVEILDSLGCRTELCGDYISVNPQYADGFVIHDTLMRKMRSSIIFLGSILARRHHARVSFPGGCDIGTRPIDLHLSALSKMGVEFSESHGYLDCRTRGLKGADINLTFPSVGATENVMLSAVRAEGITTIRNAAKEPEIIDLQGFLNAMGADVSGAGTGTIVINGRKSLGPVRYRIISDRIAAGTYMCAVAAAGGSVLLKNIDCGALWSTTAILRDAGCTVEEHTDMLRIESDGMTQTDSSGVIRTMPYPGFPTDMGSPMVAAMCLARGTTVFVETIFENRYKYVGELLRMGARIRTDGRVAVIDGVRKLYGARVEASDLRGGAALVVAALAAEGQTVINNAEYIERGYEHIDRVLSDLGADIKYA